MNWNMLGHEWAVNLLQKQIANGKHRHAYLFTGPAGIGRRTLALRMAQALNCPQPTNPGIPCRSCRSCVLIERMQHPDLSIVAAESIGGTLKVDQIRELQHSLSLAPYEARFRIALLLRFEEAHRSAANALLKTLEEPPPNVILFITAESVESLPATIVSRCEVIRLRPLTREQVQEGLQSAWGVPPEQAKLLAHLSEGRPGYAIRLHQLPEILKQRQAYLDDHHQLLGSDRIERFAYAQRLAKEKEKLPEALRIWLSFWRDVLLFSSNAAVPLTNPDQIDRISELAEHTGMDTAYRMISAIQRTSELLGKNVNARLAAEVLMLDMPRINGV